MAGVIVSTTCLLNEAEVGVVCCPLDDLISADVVGQHVGGVVRGEWVGMGKEGRRGKGVEVLTRPLRMTAMVTLCCVDLLKGGGAMLPCAQWGCEGVAAMDAELPAEGVHRCSQPRAWPRSRCRRATGEDGGGRAPSPHPRPCVCLLLRLYVISGQNRPDKGTHTHTRIHARGVQPSARAVLPSPRTTSSHGTWSTNHPRSDREVYSVSNTIAPCSPQPPPWHPLLP